MRLIIYAILSLVMTAAAFRPAGDFTLKGFVLTPEGAPIAGCTVCVEGKKNCTYTAADGSFSILVPLSKAKLSFTVLGYEKTVMVVRDDGKPLQVKLKPSVSALREVVVTGYATTKSDEALSSVQSKSRRELNGSVAGVQLGAPGTWAVPPADPGAVRYHRQGFDSERYEAFNREGYEGITENRFLLAGNTPLSTFSIDVDGASYANIRRFLDRGQLPPPGSVRIEEMINYFHYDYPQPEGEEPFSINTEIADCPWQRGDKLVLIGLQGRKIPVEQLPASNLVFLIDVSGSMMEPDKLPLVKASLGLLVDQLRDKDKVSLVAYAGNAGLVLPATSGAQKQKIKTAIENLEAGGSTAGGAGIQLAYKVAKENFLQGANNRVILCTDGDFNVGVSSDAALEALIENERKSGVFLSVLGFGTGNYQDAKMQKLADKGNGNHSYIDRMEEARKVFVNEFGGTLFTIAKDVKLQIEFNPQKVQAYRLIGYENRILNKEDFNNDQKDAGDLGSGHTVTALYEIIPVGVKSPFIEKTDPLKYQEQNRMTGAAKGNEMLTIKFRYKNPDADTSRLIEHPVLDHMVRIEQASQNFRFASAVAAFGMLLRHSEFSGGADFGQVISLARSSLGSDKEGYRAQFMQLVEDASALTSNRKQIRDPVPGDGLSR